jgi:hypothetical protein
MQNATNASVERIDICLSVSPTARRVIHLGRADQERALPHKSKFNN